MRPASLEGGTEVLPRRDRRPQPGTARAALAQRDFRVLWLGSFAANVGTWMQNVTLGAFAYELTRSATFAGLLIFAQLGPILFLSVVGGVLADSRDRKRLMIVLQTTQLALSLVLAAVVALDDPPRVALLLVVLGIGVGNALKMPAYTSVVPDLVGHQDLPGAISLNSAQMNGSRVIGPVIAGMLVPLIGATGVFVIAAGAQLFVLAATAVVRIPDARAHAGARADGDGDQGFGRLLSGFRIARQDPLVSRILLTLSLYSFFSLPFIGQMPVVAAENLDMRPKSLGYGVLYATFGFGACLGALSIGTVLARADKAALVRRGLAAFAVALAVFALLRHPSAAYPVMFAVGFTYFATTTCMLTVLQIRLDNAVRGRVMALWMMAFGGTIPLGNLLAGPVADAVSITFVLAAGAVVAAVLAWWADLARLRDQTVAGLQASGQR
jgi:predicted MFS family arabinose efflux permease